jgi:predicted nucleotidyltransferase
MDRFQGSAPIVCPYSLEDLELHTWFERDRKHVELRDPVTQETIIEFWDEDVDQLVEDGFLDPKDWKWSLFQYARYLEVIV